MASANTLSAKRGHDTHGSRRGLQPLAFIMSAKRLVGWTAGTAMVATTAIFLIGQLHEQGDAPFRSAPGLAGADPVPTDLPEALVAEGAASALHASPIKIAYSEGQFSRSLRYDGIEGFVEVLKTERDPISEGDWESKERYSVSFADCLLTARTSHEIYLAGIYDSGVVVLESWRFSSVPGEYRSMRAKATGGIGVPFVTPPTTFSIVGGTFVEPDERSATMHMRRTIWSGVSLGKVRGLIADPDGRFLLVYSADNEALFQIPTGQDAVPTIAFDSTMVPALAEGQSLCVRDHALLGRTYVLDLLPSSGMYCALLPDYDNDGVLDDCIVYDATSYANDGIGQGWLRNYRTTF